MLLCPGTTSISRMAIPFALVLLTERAALGQPIVIDFEDQAVGQPIYNQYQSKGVLFPNRPVIALQSGSHVLMTEPLFQEFSPGPLRIVFTGGQSHVKMTLGLADGAHTRTAKLTAFDSEEGGVVVASAEKTLTGPGPTPVTIPIEVSTAQPSIRRVEIEYPLSGFEVIDNLEFDTAGPAPSVDTVPPVVTLSRPADGVFVSQLSNQVLLGVTINENVMLKRVTITIQGDADSTSFNYCGPTTSSCGGPPQNFTINTWANAFFGHNTITITAEDFGGNIGTDHHSYTINRVTQPDLAVLRMSFRHTPQLTGPETDYNLNIGSLTIGRKVYLACEFANQGADLVSAWKVRASVDGSTVGEQDAGPLSAGQEKAAVWPFTPDNGGQHTYECEVDSRHTVSEVREDNNLKSRMFVVANLPVHLHPQETSLWCWAASTQMVIHFLGNNVPQCTQANKRFGRNDCCNTTWCPSPSSDHPCVKGGWPEFDKYNFTFSTTGLLSWAQLKSEILAQRPVAFAWKWVGDAAGHIMVAIGFQSVNGVDYVSILDPWAPCQGDERVIPYSEYKELANDHTHWRDYYNVKPK